MDSLILYVVYFLIHILLYSNSVNVFFRIYMAYKIIKNVILNSDMNYKSFKVVIKQTLFSHFEYDIL